MASISKYDSGIVVRWDKDDWLKGLSPVYGTGIGSRPDDGLMFASAIDPYRRYGFICPAFAPQNATNASVISAMLNNGTSNGNKAYCIENGTKLHEITVASVMHTVTNSGNFPHTITAHGGHSNVVGSDVAIYELDGTKYVFYSWNDNTDGDIGRYDLSSTFDDDYVSTVADNGAVLDKDYSHPMIVGDDGILYIGNGNNVASLQGFESSNGIFNESALDLPSGFVVSSFAKDPLHLVVYAYKDTGGVSGVRGEAKAFFWDMVSSSYTYAVTLPGSYVNGGFQYFDGSPACFTFGQSYDNTKQARLVRVGYFDSDIVVEFDENIPGHGGVETVGNMVYWNSGGNIFSYGSPLHGTPNALQKILKSYGSADEGMLKNFLGSSIVASSGVGESGGLNMFRSGFSEQALFWTGKKQVPTSGRDVWQVDFVKVGYYGTINDEGTRFDIAIETDGANNNDDARGIPVYIYESKDAGSATIDKLIKTYSHASGISSTGSLPTVNSSLGIFCNWTGGGGTDTTNAPCIEYVEVYLTRKALSETNP